MELNRFDMSSNVLQLLATHIDIAASVGIPACSLVITRRLCQIARLRTDIQREVKPWHHFYLLYHVLTHS